MASSSSSNDSNSSNSHEFFDSQLVGFIRIMENDGLLDSNFANTRSLKEDNGPFFFAELIPAFFNEMGAALAELDNIMSQPTTDFHGLLEICYKTIGTTGCLGISRLRNAIIDLKVAAIDRSKESRVKKISPKQFTVCPYELFKVQWCVSCLNIVKNEYDSVHEKLEIVLQLERRTLTHQGA